MMNRSKQIEIKDIPTQCLYEGYLWLSDCSKPLLMKDQLFDFSLFKDELPFIVEGNLWASKEAISIQIRHVDGQYHIMYYDLKGIRENSLLNEKSYIAHHIKGYDSYNVVEAWEEVADELSNMKTLMPSWTAFTGFSNPKNEE